MSTFIVCRTTYIFCVIFPVPARNIGQNHRHVGNRHDQPHRTTSARRHRSWYSLFNVASRGDVKAIQEQILTEDYESCAGYLPGECWGRETSIKVVSNFANTGKIA